MDTVLEKLKKISSKEQSKWVENARWMIANESWLEKSAKIALRILRTLREKGIKQVDLAKQLSITPQQVSKIVKGQENLTLETISRIETALGIDLIEIPPAGVTIESIVNKKLYLPEYKNNEKLPTQKGQFKEMQKPIACKIYNFRKDVA